MEEQGTLQELCIIGKLLEGNPKKVLWKKRAEREKTFQLWTMVTVAQLGHFARNH